MADVFLSYSRADAERVAGLAGALEDHGWSVFWDTVVLPGQRWRDVIHRELSDAKCVIVVWSVNSSNSNWVVEEASEALAEGKLVPVMVDSAEPPFGFRSVEAADLRTWEPGEPNRGFDVLIDAMTSIVGSPSEGVDAMPPDGDGAASGAATVVPMGGVAGGDVADQADQEPAMAPPPSLAPPAENDVSVATSIAESEAKSPEAPASGETQGGTVVPETPVARAEPEPDEAITEEDAPVTGEPTSAEGEAADPDAPLDTPLVEPAEPPAEQAAGKPLAQEFEGDSVKQEPASRSDRTAPPTRLPDARPGVPPRRIQPGEAGSARVGAGETAAGSGQESVTTPKRVAPKPTTPAAVPPQESKPRISPKWLIAIGGAVVALILIVVFSRGGDDDPGGGTPGLDEGAATDTAAPAEDAPEEVFAPALVESATVVAERAPGPMTIDGSPDDWVGITKAYLMFHPVRDTAAVEERLGADSAGEVSVAYDEEALYLLALVDDDVYSQPNEGNQIWRGDALDLNVSTVPVDATPPSPDARTFQVTMTPLSEVSGRPGHVVFVGNGEQFLDNRTDHPIALFGTVDPAGLWRLEAAIPWSVLGLDGPPVDTPFGALFSVFDNDGETTADGKSRQTVILGHVPEAAFQSDVRSWGAFDLAP